MAGIRNPPSYAELWDRKRAGPAEGTLDGRGGGRAGGSKSGCCRGNPNESDMRATLAQAYIPHVAPSLDKQLLLSDVVGGRGWHFDLAAGVLAFDSQYRWHVHPLGTESAVDGSWLWAWANSASNIPDRQLTASRTLKAYGERHGIPELTRPELPLDHVDGHTLAVIGSGVCGANAYYRCPYAGGALFVLIKDEHFPKCPDPPLRRIATVFPQAIASLDIPDHRLALAGYLEYYGLAFEADGTQIVVKEGGRAVLTASFDELNRLKKLEATVKPHQEA